MVVLLVFYTGISTARIGFLQFVVCIKMLHITVPVLPHLNFVPQPVWNEAPEGHYNAPFPVYNRTVAA